MQDITTFLTWSCNPYQDEMRLMGLKACLVISIMFLFSVYAKRLKWGVLKSQRIVSDTIN